MSPKAAVAVVVLLVGGALAACGASNSACFRSCPPLAGQWAVTFEPATDPSECQTIGATLPDGVLALAQETSALSATFEGQQLSGTAYDTGSFTLDGLGNPDAGGLDAYSFRGAYVAAPDGGTDGDSLEGFYDATLQRPGPQGTVTCRMVRSYTASRR